MNKHLGIFLLLSATSLLSQGADTNSAGVVVLQSRDREILTAFPILDNTTLKFLPGSVVIKKDDNEIKVEKGVLKHFMFEEDLVSEFNVTTRDSVGFPIEGLTLILADEYKDDLEITGMTGSDGKAVFSDVPTGYYTLYVADSEENRYPNLTQSHIHHGYGKDIELVIFKSDWQPQLDYTILKTAHDLYTVKLCWDYYEEAHSYVYHILLNGEEAGETSENTYEFPNMEPGEYVFTVIPETAEGTLLANSLTVKITQDDFYMASVGAPETDTFDYPLYNLNGQIVKNPTPGIYIRNHRKIIIK